MSRWIVLLGAALAAPSPRAQVFAPPSAALTAGAARRAVPSVPDRLERLKPLLDRVGLMVELKNGGKVLRWSGGAEIDEPKLSAVLDELDWLEALPGLSAAPVRPARENLLWDYDRQRLEASYFRPALDALGGRLYLEDQGRGALYLAADGTVVSGGRLDAYFRSLEEARRAGSPAPAFRGFDLVPGLSTAWAPGRVDVHPGDHVSLRLINPGHADAFFHLDGPAALDRRVPAGGGTVVSFIAARGGVFLYSDPDRPASPAGSLVVQP